MAVALNKHRKRDSTLLVALILAAIFFTRPLVPMESAWHESVEFAGYFLVALCVCGRIYTTAFLGGHKNERLVEYGPFSVTRNPLYLFSLCGFTGICLMTNHILITLVAPGLFILVYYFLIRREEVFLLQKFGAEYESYMRRVPRLFPRVSLYHAPETVEMRPRFLLRAFRDNLWWFASFPLIEFSEFLQEQRVIAPLFLLP
jgi:protein-S-isoprenylcysteine O-methyltransferase Ste14